MSERNALYYVFSVVRILLYPLALPRRDKQVALFNGHVFAMLAMASAWVDAPARTKV